MIYLGVQDTCFGRQETYLGYSRKNKSARIIVIAKDNKYNYITGPSRINNYTEWRTIFTDRTLEELHKVFYYPNDLGVISPGKPKDKADVE